MATLYTKVKLYLEANSKTWEDEQNNIALQNDGDGDYIHTWSVDGLDKPTDSQLASYDSAGDTAETNAGIDADIIEIAGFPLEVSPDSKPQSDSKFSVNYNLSLTQNLNNPRGDAINYFLAAATTYQSRFTQFDQRSFVFGLNSRLDVEEGRLGLLKNPSVTPSFTRIQVYLSGKALLESNAFSVSHSGSLANGSVFEYGFNVDKRNFIGLDAKSGYRYGAFVNNTFNPSTAGVGTQSITLKLDGNVLCENWKFQKPNVFN